MKFSKSKESMFLKTTRGIIEITSNEYYFIESKRSVKPVIINKEGIQKIEDFFGGQFLEPVVSQVWNTPTNYNVVATSGLEINGQVFYGVACANTLNLTDVISQAYPVEMAIKRAKATVALEVLRKNYIGDERLPLLYSSMDEFGSEASINKNIEIKDDKSTSKNKKIEDKPNKTAETNVKKETAKETPVEKTEKKETVRETKSDNKVEEKAVKEDPVDETPTDNKSDDKSVDNKTEKKSEEKDTKDKESDDETLENVGDFVIKTYRYRDGITIKELFESSQKYFKWLAENDKTQGQYVKYKKLVRQYAEENDIDISTLAAN